MHQATELYMAATEDQRIAALTLLLNDPVTLAKLSSALMGDNVGHKLTTIEVAFFAAFETGVVYGKTL